MKKTDADNWYYSDKIKEHFFKPKNFIVREPKKGEFDAEGQVGNLMCGDIMKMWIKVAPKTEKIKALKWRTWGCATAIASTSVFSVMVTEKGGMKLEDALKITPNEIAARLGGMPPRKFHCSVLAHLAFRDAVKNYREKS